MSRKTIVDQRRASLAFRLAESGRHREAIDVYSELIDRHQVAELFHQRGVSYVECNEFENAYRDFSVAIELDMDCPDSYVNRANLQLRQKNYRAAVEDYSEALKRNPKSEFALNGRGYASWKLGEEEQAFSDLWDAVGLNNQYASPMYNLALLSFERRDFSQAEKWLARVSKLLPDDPDVEKLKSSILKEIGRTPAA